MLCAIQDQSVLTMEWVCGNLREDGVFPLNVTRYSNKKVGRLTYYLISANEEARFAEWLVERARRAFKYRDIKENGQK